MYQPAPTNHPFCGHYTGQSVLADTTSYEVEDFVGAKFTARMPLLMARHI